MTTEAVSDYLYSWSSPSLAALKRVRVEDDTRDALQDARTNRPSLDQRKALLELDARIGVQFAFLGFPAASQKEEAECSELVAYIASRNLAITPILMSRAVPGDLRPIIAMQTDSPPRLLVDIYINTSPLRLRVEGWDLDEMLCRIRNVARLAADENLRFRIAFEDSSRTPPPALERAVHAVLDLRPECIVLNDTVGDCDPEGASQLTAFTRDLLEKENQRIEVAWHGHNDKGLSLANALAAARSGANIISGTFLGIGERTGNTPLEQLIYHLFNAGNSMYDVSQLVTICDLFSRSVGVEVPAHQPLVGELAFSTSTGTHAAAILKARRLGTEFEDLIYSSVPAHRLTRSQRILIGPNSGRGSVRAVLDELAISYDDDLVSAVLAFCKQQTRCLRDESELATLVSILRDPG